MTSLGPEYIFLAFHEYAEERELDYVKDNFILFNVFLGRFEIFKGKKVQLDDLDKDIILEKMGPFLNEVQGIPYPDFSNKFEGFLLELGARFKDFEKRKI
jgi:hypothetical protein